MRECLDLVKLAATVSSLELREQLLKIATVYERLALRGPRPSERPTHGTPTHEPPAPRLSARDDCSPADEPPQCGKP